MTAAVADFRVEHGLRVLADARESVATGAALMLTDETAAEATLRKALASLASAMNWLEDSEHFDVAHRELHDAGAFLRRAFGCTLHQEGGSYEDRCPVAIAHKRFGLSAEMIVRDIRCSICHERTDDCVHIAGRVYNGQRCHHELADISLVGIAMVSRPAQPDARLLALPVDTNDLQQALGPGWRPGVPVSCDQCLSPCTGVEELAFGELRHGVA